MASLRTLVSPNRRAAARLIGQTRRRLQQGLVARPNLKRTKIADALGVHRSVITKHFNGTQDMTLGRVAELAWALGYEPELVLHDLDMPSTRNEAPANCPAFNYVSEFYSADSDSAYTNSAEFEDA